LTVPDRSTTRAATDQTAGSQPRLRWPAITVAAVLTIQLLGAVAVLRTPQQVPVVAVAQEVPQPAPGRQHEVTLISLGGAATDPLLRRVAPELDGAVDAVESFWGTDWSHEVVVVATGTDTEFRAQAVGVADTSHIVAVTVADHVDPVQRTVTGQRIVFAPGAVAMSPDALRIVVAHELFHYAARTDTAVDAPRWLAEGVADYIARPAVRPVTPESVPSAGSRLPQSLPTDSDFAAVEPALSLAYDRAWHFARFIADTYGAPALRSLYLRACGPGRTDVPTALREVLRAGPDAVLAGWRGWLTRNGLA
jgi:hypothetical protein